MEEEIKPSRYWPPIGSLNVPGHITNEQLAAGMALTADARQRGWFVEYSGGSEHCSRAEPQD